MNEIAKRKGLYFTDSFLVSLIKTALQEARETGASTLFYIRAYLGTELCYLFEEVRATLNTMKAYPLKRRERASQRALFYGSNELKVLEEILSNSLDELGWDENTDIYGNKQTTDF